MIHDNIQSGLQNLCFLDQTSFLVGCVIEKYASNIFSKQLLNQAPQLIAGLLVKTILFLPSAGLDIGPISDDPSSIPPQSVSQSSRPLSEEQLDRILSPELDKMVTDGKCFSYIIAS